MNWVEAGFNLSTDLGKACWRLEKKLFNDFEVDPTRSVRRNCEIIVRCRSYPVPFDLLTK
jgi:hypothetical protein